jgi:hypothetical protein
VYFSYTIYRRASHVLSAATASLSPALPQHVYSPMSSGCKFQKKEAKSLERWFIISPRHYYEGETSIQMVRHHGEHGGVRPDVATETHGM